MQAPADAHQAMPIDASLERKTQNRPLHTRAEICRRYNTSEKGRATAKRTSDRIAAARALTKMARTDIIQSRLETARLSEIPLRRPRPEPMDPYEKAAQIRARGREASRKYMQRKGARGTAEKTAKLANSRRNTADK